MKRRNKPSKVFRNPMKKFFPLLLLLASPAAAVEIRSTLVDSVQLTVDAPGLQSTRVGSQYSASGTNITASSLGGIGCSLSSPSVTSGTYSVTNDGQAFQFSESGMIGDIAVTSQSTIGTGGSVETPNLYGDTLQYQGGTAGNLAGSLNSNGVPTVTAGGGGTTAIGQRTVELSVFR